MYSVLSRISSHTRIALSVAVAVFLFVTFYVATPVHAALVSCGNDITSSTGAGGTTYTGECTVCDLAVVAMNLLGFFVAAAMVIGALLFINAGVRYITSSSNPQRVSQAHRLFTNVLIGLVIVLAAYLLIDAVMKVFMGGADLNNAGPWNQVLCEGGNNDTVNVPSASPVTVEAVPDTPVTDVAGIADWHANLQDKNALLVAMNSLLSIAQNNPALAAYVPQLEALYSTVVAVDPYDSAAAAQIDAYEAQYVIIQEGVAATLAAS